MPSFPIGHIALYYTIAGSGEPLVLIHGSWGDHRDWSRVTPLLARDFTVVGYDRRGHSNSTHPSSQGSPMEDADDLARLIEGLRLAPVHVAANSWGGIVGFHAALKYPELFRTFIAHEPPLFDLLREREEWRDLYETARRQINDAAALLAEGKHEAGARRFVETAVSGPGGWEQFPVKAKKTFIKNAHTFLDEMRSPGGLALSLESLKTLPMPVLLTCGTQSPPIYAPVADRLAESIPSVVRHTFAGAGHVPQISHPEEYVKLIRYFCRNAKTPD